MAFTYFVIPVDRPLEAQNELNRFLATERSISVTQHLITANGTPRWAVCVETAPSAQAASKVTNRSERKDYREILSTPDFAKFAELRVLRKAIAAQNGVPPYGVFTDAQLAAMVTGNVTTKSQLSLIDGVGEARLRDYGQAFLELLSKLASANTP